MKSRQFRADISDIDLRLLRVFRAVVQFGGYAGAEIELNKSKSAISMDLANLEARLGIKLCRRGRAGFSLTREGQMVHSAMTKMFSDLDRFRDYVNLATSTLTGEISIELDDSIVFSAEDMLSRAINSFTDKHPHVYIDIQSSSPSKVEQAIINGTTDLGITTFSRSVSGLSMTPLFEEEIRLYCGSGHPLFDATEDSISVDEIVKYPVVDITTRINPKITGLIDRFPIRASSNTDTSRVALILSGNFLGFLPVKVGEYWERRGSLRQLNGDTISYTNTCFCVWRKDATANLIRDSFASELQNAIKENPVP